MTKQEYDKLQAALSKKLEPVPYSNRLSGKYGEGYREAILAAKSILSDYYKSKGETNHERN